MRQKQILEHVFPALHGRIHGENYPATYLKETIASLMSTLQMVGIAMIFFGEKIFTGMGLEVPSWQKWMAENKMMSGLMIMLGGNLTQQLRMSGAFEVLIHGDLAYSRLASGQVPAVEDVAAALIQVGYTPIANFEDVFALIRARANQ